MKRAMAGTAVALSALAGGCNLHPAAESTPLAEMGKVHRAVDV